MSRPIVVKVKFMGSLLVPGSREEPPDGAVCARAVRYLVRQRSRQRFRYGIAKELVFVVSPNHGCVAGAVREVVPGRAPRGQPLVQALLQVCLLSFLFRMG